MSIQLSAKRETSGEKSRQLRDAQQDARDKMEVKILLKGLSRGFFCFVVLGIFWRRWGGRG